MRRRQVCAKLMNCPQCATFGLIGGTAVNVRMGRVADGLAFQTRRRGRESLCSRRGRAESTTIPARLQ